MSAYSDYLRKKFNRIACVLEFYGGLPKAEAQLEAARLTGELAMAMNYPWDAAAGGAGRTSRPGRPGAL